MGRFWILFTLFMAGGLLVGSLATKANKFRDQRDQIQVEKDLTDSEQSESINQLRKVISTAIDTLEKGELKKTKKALKKALEEIHLQTQPKPKGE